MISSLFRGPLPRAFLLAALGFLGTAGPAPASGPDMYFDAPNDKRMALAVAAGDVGTIEELLSSKAVDPLKIGRNATSWIEIAVLADQRRSFEALLKWGALGPPQGKIAGQAMYSATVKGNLAWLERLYRAGASLDNYGGGELLLITAINIRNASVLDFYLRNGANLDMKSSVGGSAVLSAADAERFDIANMLLDRGASPWVMDSFGTTLGYSAEEAAMTPSWDHSSRMNAHRLSLLERLRKIGFPNPAPTPDQGHALRRKKQWPPKAAMAR